MAIYFITSKVHKFNEAKEMVPQLRWKNIDLTEIQDIDPKNIIKAKMKEARKKVHGSIVVDDVSIYFDVFGNYPGPMVKWIVETLGPKKIYKMLKKLGNTKMTWVCTVGFFHNGRTRFFRGVVKGKAMPPKGKNGFGLDPIFMPEGFKKTFAQMKDEEKNKISHRGIAFKKLARYLG